MHRLSSRFKWYLLTPIVLLMLCSMSLIAPSAHAQSLENTTVHTATLSGYGYDNQDPYKTGCASDSYTAPGTVGMDFAGGYGHVWLKWSPTCHTAWAYVQFNYGVPNNAYGDAYVGRTNTNGSITWASCATGDQYVSPGQTSCYSGMLYDGPGLTAYARGSYWDPNGTYYEVDTARW
ncbi:DUF2690 domain-containing protein [Tengunoibacter tsumagoiensis]|uniref:DUF2690 domain-containing protein n=1 Tax=Tengunoibacter tsumagoiensis TaxID=2014871 RepID=A0A402A8V5_9CHLR|nr:DUF2690 domain-containing protein [Tengunoibacter tsumagoiensis]GCE15549.1 hypothetical protein KTT_54080 [Tengunoibacter tsumagoiensis]